MRQCILILLVVCSGFTSVQAQTVSDSLRTRLAETQGAERLRMLSALVEATYRNAPEEAIGYGREALTLLAAYPDAEVERQILFRKGQAIAGLTVHRMGKMEASMVEGNSTYEPLFGAAFPTVPEAERLTTERAGLAIAAYERTLLPNQAPFQRWLRGEAGAMTEQEKEGAILFFGKVECATCHTGPALSSMSFHALGVSELQGGGVYGDFAADVTTRLGRGGFTGRAADNYKFKTPQLYNLSDSPFYGHGAEFRSIREVVEYKNQAVPNNPEVPASQLAAAFKPLGLTAQEVDALVAFLQNALRDPDLMRYVPESLPTGNCFPVNDPEARLQLGC